MKTHNNEKVDLYEGFNAFKIGFVSENISHLMGEVLTVVDASTEGEKNKAMKDLIRKAFTEKMSWFRELSWKLEEGDNEAHTPGADWEEGLVPVEVGKRYFFKY